MADLAELERRLSEATGPDWELDADIIKALGFDSWAGRMRYRDPDWTSWDFGSSEITRSVDAALALVERLGFTIHTIHHGLTTWLVDICRPNDATAGAEAKGPTLQHAILLALIRSLQAKP